MTSKSPLRFPDPDEAREPTAPYREAGERPIEPLEPGPAVARRPEPPRDELTSRDLARSVETKKPIVVPPPDLDREEIRAMLAVSAEPLRARSRWNARLVLIPLIGLSWALRSSVPWPVVVLLLVACVVVFVIEIRKLW